MEPKECSWAWVTASRLLTDRECELVYAFMVPSAATTDTVLYNGVDAYGEEIVALVASNVTTTGTDLAGKPFAPPVPIYCPRGLYITKGTNVTGIFVLWHNL